MKLCPCGQWFSPKRPWHRFHEPRCRWNFYNIHSRKKENTAHSAPVAGVIASESGIRPGNSRR